MFKSHLNGCTFTLANGTVVSFVADRQKHRLAYGEVSSEKVDLVVEYGDDNLWYGPYTMDEAAEWLAKIAQMKVIDRRLRQRFNETSPIWEGVAPDAYWLGRLEIATFGKTVDAWFHEGKFWILTGNNAPDRIVDGGERAIWVENLFDTARSRAKRCGLISSEEHNDA